MFRQGSAAIEGRRYQSKSVAALHRDTSRRSQDPFETPSSSSLHYNAQSNLDRVFDSVGTASIYTEHTHGSSQAPRHVHARLSRPQHIPPTLSLLLDIRSSVPSHHWPSPRSLSASEGRHWFGSFNCIGGLGRRFREVQKKLCDRTRV